MTKSRGIGRGGSERRPLETSDDRYVMAYVNMLAHRPKPNGRGRVGIKGAVESFAIIADENLTDGGVKRRINPRTGRIDPGGRGFNNLQKFETKDRAFAIAGCFRKRLGRLRKAAVIGAEPTASDAQRLKGVTADCELLWLAIMGKAYHAAVYVADGATAWDTAWRCCHALNEQDFFAQCLAPHLARRFDPECPFVVPTFLGEKGAL